MIKFADVVVRAFDGFAHLAQLIDLDWRACT